MPEISLLDQEKIKEFVKPIDLLQETLNELNDLSVSVRDLDNLRKHFSYNEEFTNIIKNVIKEIKNINQDFKLILKNNLSVFLFIQDTLYEKYKLQIIDLIEKSQLDAKDLKNIGLYLIDKKKISRIPKYLSFVKVIGITQWIDLLDVLKEITIFKKTINRLEEFYHKVIIERLNKELEKIPPGIDNNIIIKFKELFLENPNMRFNAFLNKIEEQETQLKLKAREFVIKERKEKEKLEDLKKKQEERKNEYQDYLNLSEKEFERKIRKKKRVKLSEIVESKKGEKQLTISDDVSEKIKKYKSKFDENFKDNYLSIEENDRKPIDLIRERKKKKTEEYTKYKDHFNNV